LGKRNRRKIAAVQYAEKIKFRFGICLGMQMAIIEHAKCIGFVDANRNERTYSSSGCKPYGGAKKQLLIKVEQCAWSMEMRHQERIIGL
jgi:hypothetical protein